MLKGQPQRDGCCQGEQGGHAPGDPDGLAQKQGRQDLGIDGQAEVVLPAVLEIGGKQDALCASESA